MRNFALIAVCASLFGAHFLSQDESAETQAASRPSVSQPSYVIKVTSDQDAPSDEKIDTQFVTLRSNAVCTAGSCGVASGGSSKDATVRRGLFGRRIVSYSGRSRSGWYPGKNLGRLFSRR